MSSDFDRDKVVECMFDPITSSIIAELEGGSKLCEQLARVCSISEGEVRERLSYLIKHGFIVENSEGKDTTFKADEKKLSSIIEQSENFDGAINGLTKMDSYLN